MVGCFSTADAADIHSLNSCTSEHNEPLEPGEVTCNCGLLHEKRRKVVQFRVPRDLWMKRQKAHAFFTELVSISSRICMNTSEKKNYSPLCVLCYFMVQHFPAGVCTYFNWPLL